MKKEREVKTKAKVVKTPAKTKIVTDVFCDMCGKQVDLSRDNHYGSGGHNCQICHRDLCRNENPSDEGFSYTCRRLDSNLNDEPSDLYCPICWVLKFTKYKEEAEANDWLYESLQNKLTATIKKESLATKKK